MASITHPRTPGVHMAVTISETLYQELLAYLQSQPEDDDQAEVLYYKLQQAEIHPCDEQLKIEGKLPPKTNGGAYLV
ncbi:MAG TPA: hypothetical protein V6C91_16040 [Coleofasciculaceae cyanobacterium]